MSLVRILGSSLPSGTCDQPCWLAEACKILSLPAISFHLSIVYAVICLDNERRFGYTTIKCAPLDLFWGLSEYLPASLEA